MIHRSALLTGCLCLALVAFVGAAPSTQPAEAQKENGELRKRVAALEAQVKSLEEQVARLKRREGMAVIPERGVRAVQETVPVAPTPGQDWVARQFNGRTYYLVPCQAGTATVMPKDAGEVEFENFVPMRIAPAAK